MLGNWFYHERIRKAVAVFGSLFNNIYVVRHNSAGDVINETKVPLSYAPRRDFMDRISGMEIGEQQERQIAIKLPRMSFEILAISYDAARQLSKVGARTIAGTSDSTKARRMYNPVPYNLQFQLNVYARSQDDALQVVEQIIPYFTPQYTVTVKPLTGYDITEDTPIKLDGVVMQDDYEGAIETRRTIIYTLDFEMKINMYKVVESASSIIRTVETSLLDFDTGGLLAFCKVESNILSGDSASLPFNILEDAGQTATNTISLKNTLNDIQGYSIITDPEFGTAIIDSDGTWTYTPNPDAYGPDAFVVGVDVGQNVIENINIAINGPVNAGVDDAVDDSFTLDYSGAETLTMNVASNDLFETVGDITHTVQSQPAQGTVTIIDSLAGTFLYTPPAAPFGGTVTWQYRAIPDGAENSAEVGDVTIVVTDTSNIDDDFANVTLLLNNVNGQVVDQSNAANTITENGTVLYSSESPGAGFNPSLNLDGNWNITGLYDGDLGGDFTIEMWVNTYSDATLQNGKFIEPNTAGSGTWTVQMDTTTQSIDINGLIGGSYQGSQDISTQQWVHVAITRSGTTLKRWVNGVGGTSVTNSDTFNNSDFKIGVTPGNIYLNDVRITKGVARYTGNFIPPTEKFPTS
jgi:hypothetical protein